MLPIIENNLWARAMDRMHLFASEGTHPLNSTESEARTLDSKNWENHPAAEISKTGIWSTMLLLSTLVLVMYGPVLSSLARQWWNDPNYGHGFFVPVFAIYVLWQDRDRWRAVPFNPSNFGFAIMLFAIGLQVLGTLGAELFMTRMSLLFLIPGIVLFLAGRKMLRAIAFPLGYLIFMIPLPAIIYYQLTFPMQLLASRLGASGLVALGIHTVREGNLLLLPNCTLNVVEACSGVRSLLSLLAAVVAYAYFVEETTPKRIALVVASIPIAIATNGLRLVATGLLSFYFGPKVDFGVVHLALGLGFFALAFFSILLLHKLLRLSSSYKNPAQVYP